MLLAMNHLELHYCLAFHITYTLFTLLLLREVIVCYRKFLCAAATRTSPTSFVSASELALTWTTVRWR